MQRKCPSGHARAWQGLHSIFSQSTRAAEDGGGVCSGLDEPNSATWGVPVAAATCISPESLVTTDAAPAIRSMASSSVVCPTRFLPGICSASFLSDEDPSKPIWESSFEASSRKCGQRVAGPYSAPGQNTG